jgi:hypothetical protein
VVKTVSSRETKFSAIANEDIRPDVGREPINTDRDSDHLMSTMPHEMMRTSRDKPSHEAQRC